LKLLLNIGSYDLSLKGQVRHATGRGNGNRISARETGKSYTSRCKSSLRKRSSKKTLRFELQA